MNIYCVKSCNLSTLYKLRASDVFDELMDDPVLFLQKNDAIKAAESECWPVLNDPDFTGYTMGVTHDEDGDITYTVAKAGEHADPILLIKVSRIECK